jgi:YrbI family 3-deoxy-D-manno-octulosonate 8-phosphate phosphatase
MKRLARSKKADIRKIRMVAFDFDGVFTDNAVWVDETGRESVRCCRSDGLGLKMLKEAGIHVCVFSTETNPVVSARCRKLKLPCVQGLEDKGRALEVYSRRHKIPLSGMAYVGNDINDLDCLRTAGLAIVVSDAYPEAIAVADWQTQKPGGYGAVREICEWLVKSLKKR